MAVNDAVRDLLGEARKGLALDTLAAEAKRKDLRVSRNTIAKARRGDLVRPTNEVVDALAELFGVDVRDLRAALGRQRGELGPYVPDARASSLTQTQRQALDRLIVAIVEGGQSWDAGNTSGPEEGDDGPTSAERRLRKDAGTEVRDIREPRLTMVEGGILVNPDDLPDDLLEKLAAYAPGISSGSVIPEQEQAGEESQDAD